MKGLVQGDKDSSISNQVCGGESGAGITGGEAIIQVRLCVTFTTCWLPPKGLVYLTLPIAHPAWEPVLF